MLVGKSQTLELHPTDAGYAFLQNALSALHRSAQPSRNVMIIGFEALRQVSRLIYVCLLAKAARKLLIRIANRVAVLYNWFNEYTHKIGGAVRLKNLKMRYCRPLGGIA